MKKITVLIILVLFALSCQEPGPGNEGSPTPSPVVTLTAPDGVSAVLSGGTIMVSWNSVPGADAYRVYRKVGEGVFEIITQEPVSSTAILDTTFPEDKPLSYGVESGSRGFFSSISTTSNSVTPNVQNVEATVLQKNGVTLMWTHITDINFAQYEVRRYDSRSAANFTNLGNPTTNEFSDTTAVPGTPYFYQVVWDPVGGGSTNGENGPLVFGLRSEEDDHYEKNDWVSDIDSFESSIFFDWDTGDWSKAPQSYSFPNGSGGTEYDRDWYKYKGPATMIFVDIKLPTVTDFDEADCKLYFRFYYNGAYVGTEKEVTTGGFSDSFGDFGGATGEVELYFEVFAVASSARDALGKYKIRWTDGL